MEFLRGLGRRKKVEVYGRKPLPITRKRTGVTDKIIKNILERQKKVAPPSAKKLQQQRMLRIRQQKIVEITARVKGELSSDPIYNALPYEDKEAYAEKFVRQEIARYNTRVKDIVTQSITADPKSVERAMELSVNLLRQPTQMDKEAFGKQAKAEIDAAKETTRQRKAVIANVFKRRINYAIRYGTTTDKAWLRSVRNAIKLQLLNEGLGDDSELIKSMIPEPPSYTTFSPSTGKPMFDPTEYRNIFLSKLGEATSAIPSVGEVPAPVAPAGTTQVAIENAQTQVDAKMAGLARIRRNDGEEGSKLLSQGNTMAKAIEVAQPLEVSDVSKGLAVQVQEANQEVVEEALKDEPGQTTEVDTYEVDTVELLEKAKKIALEKFNTPAWDHYFYGIEVAIKIPLLILYAISQMSDFDDREYEEVAEETRQMYSDIFPDFYKRHTSKDIAEMLNDMQLADEKQQEQEDFLRELERDSESDIGSGKKGTTPQIHYFSNSKQAPYQYSAEMIRHLAKQR